MRSTMRSTNRTLALATALMAFVLGLAVAKVSLPDQSLGALLFIVVLLLLFGGVIDPWSFPRILSGDTLLYTSDSRITGVRLAVPAVALAGTDSTIETVFGKEPHCFAASHLFGQTLNRPW